MAALRVRIPRPYLVIKNTVQMSAENALYHIGVFGYQPVHLPVGRIGKIAADNGAVIKVILRFILRPNGLTVLIRRIFCRNRLMLKQQELIPFFFCCLYIFF